VLIPPIPEGDQIQAILSLLDVDRLWFPHQEGASLYIRPFVFGTQDSLGVKPSSRYTFCVFLSPSGPYYPAGFREPVKLLVTRRFHRAAPGGTGAFKTGGNYAASLLAGQVAHEHGASQVLFLDVTDRYIEEAGAMNHFHVTRKGELLIPTFTETILRSITSESVLELGEHHLGVRVRQEVNGEQCSAPGAMGFRAAVRRSTLADANELREWLIWADLAAVLIRRARHYGIELKSLAVFAGVVVVGLAYVLLVESPAPPSIAPAGWLLVAVVGVVLLAINLVVQHGLTQVLASRAVVIFLFELVVAALASWWLAGEAMGPREWLGGALIVAASVLAARLEQAEPPQAGSGNASR